MWGRCVTRWAAPLVAATLAVAGGLFAAAPAQAATVTPVADSYVDAGRPDRNYGSRVLLRADNSPERITYLKFTVSGSGTGGSALLRIYARSSNEGISVRSVADSSWTESGITYANRPALGPVVGSSYGGVTARTWVNIDVSSAVTGDGTYTFAVTTSDDNAVSLSSRDTARPPKLLVPVPAATRYDIAGSGGDASAVSDTGIVLTGSLKSVVEQASLDLAGAGGGTVAFGVGTYDLGTDHFELDDIDHVTFQGRGAGRTHLVNWTDEATDTEVFDIVHADHVTIRNLSIAAGGPFRSTSDAIDFDDGNNSVVERVTITESRGRGIVFDGKGDGWSAQQNLIRNCVIRNLPSDGIELLAASDTTIDGCRIRNVAGHGIQVTKSSSQAATPNKQSVDIGVKNNIVTGAGRDGININSSRDVRVLDNSVSNSSQVSTGRDGVRIESFDGVDCDDNFIDRNTLFDDQATPTQSWGLNIASPNCHRTSVGQLNYFSGNRRGDIQDNGTGTLFAADTTPPTAPADVTATAVSHAQVEVSWTASQDNKGVTGYTVRRDGSPVGTVDGATTAFTDFTAAPETTYAYTVVAGDAAGNTSAPSSPEASVTTPSLPSSFSLGAEADAYVDAANPTSTYGSSTELRVDASPELTSYVRFQVTGTGSVASAVLRVRADSTHGVGFAVHTVGDNGWSESLVTYDTRPAVGTHLGDSGPTTAGEYVEIDVSALVQGDGAYTFALVPLNSTNLRLSSRESGAGPELRLQL